MVFLEMMPWHENSPTRDCQPLGNCLIQCGPGQCAGSGGTFIVQAAVEGQPPATKTHGC